MFDRAKEYDNMLHQGISLSGENKFYFILGRIKELFQRLPANLNPRRILDFGCGTGDTTKLLAEIFPEAKVFGFDTSDEAIAHSHQLYGCDRISFFNLDRFPQIQGIELCYTNGVFHHILPEKRMEVISRIHRMMTPGGYFAFFENNPWNPGTRLVMKRIPFDRDAQVLSIWEAKRLFRAGGFSLLNPSSFLFYFPRSLSKLRWLEAHLAKIPLGAQYFILAQKY